MKIDREDENGEGIDIFNKIVSKMDIPRLSELLQVLSHLFGICCSGIGKVRFFQRRLVGFKENSKVSSISSRRL